MIYSVYVSAFLGEYSSVPKEDVANAIKLAPDEDSFVFIYTTSQQTNFEKFVTLHGLKDLIQFKSEKPFVNASHPKDPPRLFLCVMSKTEVKESEYGSQPYTRGKV